MTNNNCGQRISCGFLAVVASLIIGVVSAFLSITEVLVLTPTFLFITFGVAVGFLAVLLLSSKEPTQACSCSCSAVSLATTGILGTVLFSLIFLATTVVGTTVIGAILTGLLLFFFSLILTSLTCLIKCVFCNHD